MNEWAKDQCSEVEILVLRGDMMTKNLQESSCMEFSFGNHLHLMLAVLHCADTVAFNQNQPREKLITFSRD